MVGEKDLKKLLENLSPVLLEEEYIFCSMPGSNYGEFNSLKPIASFLEKEGLTLVVEKEKAKQANIKFQATFRCISLGVHSDLVSVGLTAKISSVLFEQNISANIIAGYFHDHVFVPSNQALRAFDFLKKLTI